MKSLSEMLNSNENKADAFGKRLKLKSGEHRLVPGHVTDYMEQGGEKRTEFDPANYADKHWNMIRNTKSKKKHDVYHKVTHTHTPFKTSVIDKT